MPGGGQAVAPILNPCFGNHLKTVCFAFGLTVCNEFNQGYQFYLGDSICSEISSPICLFEQIEEMLKKMLD